MTCDFTSFSTVIQSYQDDGHVIRKGCVQWNPVYDRKDPRLRRSSNRLISRPALNPTELTGLKFLKEIYLKITRFYLHSKPANKTIQKHRTQKYLIQI